MFDNSIQNENTEAAENTAGRGGNFVRGVAVGAIGMLLVVSIALGTLGAVVFLLGRGGSGFSAGRDKLSVIAAFIDRYYYEDVKDSDLTEGMYKGMVAGIGDPYSEYYTADEYKEEQIQSTGNYSGIGATLTQDSKTMAVYIVRVYDGSPAEKAGLKAGDEIVEVDGHKAKNESLDIFVQHVRGEDGSTLKMLYRRGKKEKKVKIIRGDITAPTIEYRMLDQEHGIALIDISSFESGTAADFKKAVEDLKGQGMKAVVYDLRTNGGGLVDSVTEILDEILPEGTTVYMLDKNGEKTVSSSDEEHQLDIPTVVLVSGNTASAAEIFTGAIRDFKWGTIIGTKTYGKGVVQGSFPLADGSAVKLTIAKYYTPKGICIDKDGIKPDIKLEFKYSGSQDKKYDYHKDNQVKRAIKELKNQ